MARKSVGFSPVIPQEQHYVPNLYQSASLYHSITKSNEIKTSEENQIKNSQTKFLDITWLHHKETILQQQSHLVREMIDDLNQKKTNDFAIHQPGSELYSMNELLPSQQKLLQIRKTRQQESILRYRRYKLLIKFISKWIEIYAERSHSLSCYRLAIEYHLKKTFKIFQSSTLSMIHSSQRLISASQIHVHHLLIRYLRRWKSFSSLSIYFSHLSQHFSLHYSLNHLYWRRLKNQLKKRLNIRYIQERFEKRVQRYLLETKAKAFFHDLLQKARFRKRNTQVLDGLILENLNYSDRGWNQLLVIGRERKMKSVLKKFFEKRFYDGMCVYRGREHCYLFTLRNGLKRWRNFIYFMQLRRRHRNHSKQRVGNELTRSNDLGAKRPGYDQKREQRGITETRMTKGWNGENAKRKRREESSLSGKIDTSKEKYRYVIPKDFSEREVVEADKGIDTEIDADIVCGYFFRRWLIYQEKRRRENREKKQERERISTRNYRRSHLKKYWTIWRHFLTFRSFLIPQREISSKRTRKLRFGWTELCLWRQKRIEVKRQLRLSVQHYKQKKIAVICAKILREWHGRTQKSEIKKGKKKRAMKVKISHQMKCSKYFKKWRDYLSEKTLPYDANYQKGREFHIDFRWRVGIKGLSDYQMRQTVAKDRLKISLAFTERKAFHFLRIAIHERTQVKEVSKVMIKSLPSYLHYLNLLYSLHCSTPLFRSKDLIRQQGKNKTSFPSLSLLSFTLLEFKQGKKVVKIQRLTDDLIFLLLLGKYVTPVTQFRCELFLLYRSQLFARFFSKRIGLRAFRRISLNSRNQHSSLEKSTSFCEHKRLRSSFQHFRSYINHLEETKKYLRHFQDTFSQQQLLRGFQAWRNYFQNSQSQKWKIKVIEMEFRKKSLWNGLNCWRDWYVQQQQQQQQIIRVRRRGNEKLKRVLEKCIKEMNQRSKRKTSEKRSRNYWENFITHKYLKRWNHRYQYGRINSSVEDKMRLKRNTSSSSNCFSWRRYLISVSSIRYSRHLLLSALEIWKRKRMKRKMLKKKSQHSTLFHLQKIWKIFHSKISNNILLKKMATKQFHVASTALTHLKQHKLLKLWFEFSSQRKDLKDKYGWIKRKNQKYILRSNFNFFQKLASQTLRKILVADHTFQRGGLKKSWAILCSFPSINRKLREVKEYCIRYYHQSLLRRRWIRYTRERRSERVLMGYGVFVMQQNRLKRCVGYWKKRTEEKRRKCFYYDRVLKRYWKRMYWFRWMKATERSVKYEAGQRIGNDLQRKTGRKLVKDALGNFLKHVQKRNVWERVRKFERNKRLKTTLHQWLRFIPLTSFPKRRVYLTSFVTLSSHTPQEFLTQSHSQFRQVTFLTSFNSLASPSHMPHNSPASTALTSSLHSLLIRYTTRLSIPLPISLSISQLFPAHLSPSLSLSHSFYLSQSPTHFSPMWQLRILILSAVWHSQRTMKIALKEWHKNHSFSIQNHKYLQRIQVNRNEQCLSLSLQKWKLFIKRRKHNQSSIIHSRNPFGFIDPRMFPFYSSKVLRSLKYLLSLRSSKTLLHHKLLQKYFQVFLSVYRFFSFRRKLLSLSFHHVASKIHSRLASAWSEWVIDMKCERQLTQYLQKKNALRLFLSLRHWKQSIQWYKEVKEYQGYILKRHQTEKYYTLLQNGLRQLIQNVYRSSHRQRGNSKTSFLLQLCPLTRRHLLRRALLKWMNIQTENSRRLSRELKLQKRSEIYWIHCMYLYGWNYLHHHVKKRNLLRKQIRKLKRHFLSSQLHQTFIRLKRNQLFESKTHHLYQSLAVYRRRVLLIRGMRRLYQRVCRRWLNNVWEREGQTIWKNKSLHRALKKFRMNKEQSKMKKRRNIKRRRRKGEDVYIDNRRENKTLQYRLSLM